MSICIRAFFLGLFSAAIQQSGSALSPWALYRNQSRVAHDLAKAINPDEYSKHNSSSKALLEYLQSVSADQIDAASVNLVGTYMNSSRSANNISHIE